MLEALHDLKAEGKYKIRERFELSGWWVWSCTKKGSASAWYFDFDDGECVPIPMFFSAIFRALCVRSSGK